MLKFNRSKKRLVIPVGINPNYGIDIADLYNTTDADVEANDVLEGKIAYGKDGKIVGTLDVQSEKEESYQEGYEFGYNEGNNAGYRLGYDEGNEAGIDEQKSKLESITITENGSYNREDGWNSVVVEVPDLNGDYNEGVEAGIEIGKAEVIEGMNDATITAGTVFKGEVGYGKDGERIVGDYEFVEGFDFGIIGYSKNESDEVNRSISDDIMYSKQLYDAWDPNRTSAQSYFSENKTLVYAPQIDTSNVNSMSSMFYNCTRLTSVPTFNTSNVNSMSSMFYNCTRLTSVPTFNTSNVNSMSSMFASCSNLTSVPQFDTSKVTNMNSMFRSCTSLTSVLQFDTSKVTDMYEMFGYCSNLTSVPQFDTSKVSNINSMFVGCNKLTTVPEFNGQSITGTAYHSTMILSSAPLITNFGGLKDLGKGYTGSSSGYKDFELQYSSKLTYESCINVINKVYDMNLNTQNTYTPKIRFHATPYALLSADDIAIATAKGWTVQAG